MAWWLRRAGWSCTVLEKSKALRGEGYMMDFFGSGYDAAEQMGLLGRLAQIHYPIERLTFLDDRGRTQTRVSYAQMRRVFDGRHFNFMRGDLERVLFEEVRDSVRFGAAVHRAHTEGSRAVATLADGTRFEADLLVAADGVHSTVRAL